MSLSKELNELLQEVKNKPLQLTYNTYYGGNAKSKRRRRLIEDERQKTLEMFRNWRKLKEFEDAKKEKIKKHFNIKQPVLKDKEKKLVFFVKHLEKKRIIQKVGRFHYFNLFLISCIFSLTYLVSVNFNIFKNLFFLILSTAMLVPSTIFFLTNMVYSARVISHIDNIDISKYVILRMGEPGTGKSSSACNDSYVMAEKIKKKLYLKYWLIKNKIDKIYSGTHIEHKVLGKDNKGNPIIYYYRVYTSSQEKIERTVEIVESYEFYQEHPEVIPCLYSSIPVQDDQGRTSLQFTADHLLQKEKLLSYGVAFLDEIGSMLPPQLSNQKIEVVDLSFRFTRQFHEFHLISTEQDGKAVVISARRVTAENRRMTGQKHILKPFILNKICTKLEEVVVEKDINPTPIKVALLSTLRNYVNSVGFRKFSFIDSGNLQFQSAGVGNEPVKNKVQTFITQPHLSCNYDDRTFKNLDKAKNQAPNPVRWNGLVLSREELNKLFNREILSRAYK